MRELKILLCMPIEIVMLVINILHSIVATISTLLVNAHLALGKLYKQIIGVEQENTTRKEDDNL